MGAPAGLAAQPPRLVVAVLGWLRKHWLSAGGLGAIAGFAAVAATLAERKEGRMTVARDEPTPQERRQILLDEYQEVCKSHAAITDFRAKLLALLPVASGTGVGLLLTQADGKDGIPASLLVALGTFGALVTVGLFLYEFHQMDDCQQLRNHGVWIEKELGIVAGHFGSKRGKLGLPDIWPSRYRKRDKDLGERERQGKEAGEQAPGFVNVRNADYIVYGTVFVAWIAVLAWGLTGLAQ
jgi:hypothetical protein